MNKTLPARVLIMKDEYDLSTMKSRKNPYASKLKKPITKTPNKASHTRYAGLVAVAPRLCYRCQGFYLFICPCCNKKGISFWSKFWSGSDAPSKCEVCGKLSFVHSKYRFGFQSGWPTLGKILGAALSLFLLFQTNSIFSLFIFPVIWLACSFWELSSLPMRPITEEHAAVAKKSSNIVIVGLIIIFGLAWVVTNL